MVLAWLLPLLLSFAFGMLYVLFLTVHPLQMSRYLLGATLAFVGAVAALAVGFQGWALVLAILFSLGSALAGYSLTARKALSRGR